MILHQRPLKRTYDTLSLTNSTPLTADTVLWCTKFLFPIDDFSFLFHTKNHISCSYRAPFAPPNPPAQPINDILLPGAERPLMVESFGLLNLFPFPSILDAGYPVFDLHLANVLFDFILPFLLGSPLLSFG
jgi:hypothetical protein